MKLRFAVYFIILTFGLLSYIYITKPRFTPWYCGQYSGYNSDAWGIKDRQCEQAGCRAIKTGAVIKPSPNEIDSGATYIKCVKK